MATNNEGEGFAHSALVLADEGTFAKLLTECADLVSAGVHFIRVDDSAQLAGITQKMLSGFDLCVVHHAFGADGNIRHVVDEFWREYPNRVFVIAEPGITPRIGGNAATLSNISGQMQFALDLLASPQGTSDNPEPPAVELERPKRHISPPDLQTDMLYAPDFYHGQQSATGVALHNLELAMGFEAKGDFVLARLHYLEILHSKPTSAYEGVLTDIALGLGNVNLENSRTLNQQRRENIACDRDKQRRLPDGSSVPWREVEMEMKAHLREDVGLISQALTHRPHSLDLLVMLAHMYAFGNQRDEAYKTVQRVMKRVENQDVVHLVNNADVGTGMYVVQIAGQHKVVRFAPRRLHRSHTVIKIFTPEYASRAQLESDIMVSLDQFPEFTRMDNRDKAFYTPRTVLLQPPSGTGESYLILEDVGSRITDQLSKFDAVGRYAYLEAIVDTTTALSRTIQRLRPRELDVRHTPLQKRAMGDATFELDFYSTRFFDKIIATMDRHNGEWSRLGSQVKGQDATKLLHEYLPIYAAFKEIPDWLITIDTDANLNNFTCHVDDEKPPLQESHAWIAESVHKAVIAPIDKERADRRFVLSDIVTALEHEHAGLDENQVYYLALRSVANVALHCKHITLDEKMKLQNAVNDASFAKHCDIPTPRDISTLEKILEAGVRTYDSTFSIEKLQTWLRYASLERHMTIVGDKIRDCAAYDSMMQQIMDQTEYAAVKEYQDEGVALDNGTENQQKKRAEDEDKLLEHYEQPSVLRTLSTSGQAMRAYLRLRKGRRECDAIGTHHRQFVLQRLQELGLYALRNQLQMTFNLWRKDAKGADLHTHTEGPGTIEERVRRVLDEANAQFLGAIAIGDRNYVGTAHLATTLGERSGLCVIPAVELDTRYRRLNGARRRCHIIAYFPPDTPEFKKELDRLFARPQLERMMRMLDRMRKRKGLISEAAYQEVRRALPRYEGPFTRNTLAMFVVQSAHTHRCPLGDELKGVREREHVRYIVDQYFSEGRTCYVSTGRQKDVPNLDDAFAFCKKYGMPCGLSHLLHDEDERNEAVELLQKSVENGAQIVAVGHPRHSAQDQHYLEKAVKTHNLPLLQLHYSAGYPPGGFEMEPRIGDITDPIVHVAKLRQLYENRPTPQAEASAPAPK